MTRGKTSEQWTPDQLEQAMAQPSFAFEEMVMNVNSYLREEEDQVKGGLYFTLQSVTLPAAKKHFRN